MILELCLYSQVQRQLVKQRTVPLVKSQRLPDAIIIGVRKAGTRALIEMAQLNPAIIVTRGSAHFLIPINYSESSK